MLNAVLEQTCVVMTENINELQEHDMEVEEYDMNEEGIVEKAVAAEVAVKIFSLYDAKGSAIDSVGPASARVRTIHVKHAATLEILLRSQTRDGMCQIWSSQTHCPVWPIAPGGPRRSTARKRAR